MLKNKNIQIKNLIILLINIIFLGLFFYWSTKYFFNEEYVSNPSKLLIKWVCMLIIIQLLCFKLKEVSFYDFGLWFTVISYAFMFGFIFNDIFDLNTSLIWKPINYYSYKELFNAYSFAIFTLDCFSTGYLISYNKNNNINKQEFIKEKENKKMYVCGIILLIIGGFSKLISDIKMIFTIQRANSYAAYSTALGVGILDDLSYLCLPGIFFIFYSGCTNKRNIKRLFVLFLLYSVLMMMLTGSRKVQIFSILSLVLAYSFCTSVEERKRKYILRGCIIAIFFIILTNILIIIRNNRFNITTIIPTFINNLLSLNLFKNIVGEVFSETGITVLSVASIIKSVPDIIPFEYGFTFIRTLPSIFPIGWLVGDFFSKASSTNVINLYTKIPVGSSFLGDLYWNWGYIGGIIAAFIFGIIISRLLNLNTKNQRLKCALYFSYFSQLIVLVRAELFDVFRSMFMILLLSIIIERITIKKKGK